MGANWGWEVEAIYRQGTTKEQILFDGWSRGLSISQVVSEVKAQGFQTDDDEVQAAFNIHQREMEDYYDDWWLLDS